MIVEDNYNILSLIYHVIPITSEEIHSCIEKNAHKESLWSLTEI